MNPLSAMRQVRALGGKPLVRQLRELLACRLRASPIGVSEYFAYGLWSPELGPDELRQFIGWRQSVELDQTLNDARSRVLANDKLVNYLMLQHLGLPMPQPLATFTAEGRRIGNETVLRSLDDVRRWLDGDVYPFYVKPISAGYGRGVMGVAGRDGPSLRLLDDRTLGLDEFLKAFEFPPYGGMLFQRPLQAHPFIVALTGSKAVCSVRCICLVTPSGPQVHTAFWKIATGKNMLDNFSHGDLGNFLGAVDVRSGRIERAIARLGPGGGVDRHPDTGQPLVGFQLPDWTAALDLVHRASAHFPGLRLQNWDVALCPEGPVLIELNTESELAVPQAISGRGLMDARLRGMLAELEQAQARRRAAVAAGPR
ncbi:MAG: sugar-transfer associated ATP-grasp domain-containing protein [Inhella sp.]